MMKTNSIELESLLGEIDNAIGAKLYYLAIAVALSVPDICSSLEANPENPAWQNRKSYAGWCDANIGDRFTNLTGDDLYNLRGGVLHKGRFEHAQSRFNRVMFIGPESPFQAHDVVITIEPGVKFGDEDASSLRLEGKVLSLGIFPFCEILSDSARRWYRANEHNPNTISNLERLVRYRPEGLPPFSIGVPTVA